MQIHKIHGYIQSIYLIDYADKLLLLDGCSRADVERVTEFISQQLQRPLSDLKLIVVTHMHPDHAGGAHRLRELSGAAVASMVKAKHWYSGMRGIFMYLTDLALTWFVASRMGKSYQNVIYPRKLVVDHALQEGSYLPYFDDWQVWETPGHTDRDLSVLHLPTRTIYVADTILKVRGLLISPFPVFYPKLYRAALQRYHDSGIQQYLLAHGGQVKINRDQLSTLIEQSPDRPKTYFRFIRRATKRYIPW